MSTGNFISTFRFLLIGILMLIVIKCHSQNNPKQQLLDSLNEVREKDRGAFNLYIKKPEIEIIGGIYRNRESIWQGFDPFTITYQFYLPFQFDLNYVNVKAKDKLLKLNTTFIFHHSKFGNYAAGPGERFSFIVYKKTYLSYQLGLVWCEPVKYNTNDGFNNMGFCLQHQFSLCYNLNNHLKISANVLHLSNGKIFREVKNNQDVLGFGVSYMF